AGVPGKGGTPAMGAADAMLCTTDSHKISEKYRAASQTSALCPGRLRPIQLLIRFWLQSRFRVLGRRQRNAAETQARSEGPQTALHKVSALCALSDHRAALAAAVGLESLLPRSLGRQRGMPSSGRARSRRATMSKPPSAALISWMRRC